MSDFVHTNTISLNCNFGNDFKDLLLSFLSHSKIDLKIDQLLKELESILIFDSDETLLRYENILLKIHQMLDKKNSNCDRMTEYIHKKMNFSGNILDTSMENKELSESNSSSDHIYRENVEKHHAKVINSPNDRKKHLTKRDKNRRSLRIITQSKSISKSISKFNRASLGRYHHQLHCSTSNRRRGFIENNSNTNSAGAGKKNKENCYCYCKKGAFGKMIACDNSGCKIEWFHNKCVNVIDVPNGEWFCPECRPG